MARMAPARGEIFSMLAENFGAIITSVNM